MAKITGIVWIKINGRSVQSLEGATLDIGGLAAEPVVVPTYGLIGFVGQVQPASVEFTMPHQESTDLVGQREDWFGVSVVFETDTKIQYLVTDAFLAAPPKLVNGGSSVRMVGQVADEVAF
jgi:hypothetical protein